MFKNVFPENRAVYDIMWENRPRQATANNKIQRSIDKAKIETHS
jgi:hypothetical protein